MAKHSWREAYQLIKEMRSRTHAPVDTMGCETGGGVEFTSKHHKDLSVLVSLMLSSQTKDQVTFAAVQRLHTELDGGLTLKSLRETDEAEIDELIGKVGFHKTKAGYLKGMADRVLTEYDGQIPDTLEDLLKFKGVGPKMAFLYLQSIGKNLGIGVDVHVHRIPNRLHWYDKPTKTPEESRKALEKLLPRELYGEINPLLVGFGQTICTPVNPKCDLCSITFCPSRNVKDKTNKRSKPKIEVEIEDRKVTVKKEARDEVAVKTEEKAREIRVKAEPEDPEFGFKKEEIKQEAKEEDEKGQIKQNVETTKEILSDIKNEDATEVVETSKRRRVTRSSKFFQF